MSQNQTPLGLNDNPVPGRSSNRFIGRTGSEKLIGINSGTEKSFTAFYKLVSFENFNIAYLILDIGSTDLYYNTNWLVLK